MRTPFNQVEQRVFLLQMTEALEAAKYLTRNDGIIPALESAHALAALNKIGLTPSDVVVVNLSGRGDKDMATYINHFTI